MSFLSAPSFSPVGLLSAYMRLSSAQVLALATAPLLQPLVLFASGNPTLGDGTLDVVIGYQVVTMP